MESLMILLLLFILITYMLIIVATIVNKNSCHICGEFIRKNLVGIDVEMKIVDPTYRIQPQKYEKCDVVLCKACINAIKKRTDLS